MPNLTFEDPRKSDLRERVRIAIEASGLVLVEEPVFVAIPEASRLRGGILGDVQAMDSDSVRHAFYLRTVGDKAVPQWLANLASSSHGVSGVQVHVVVEQSTAILERSCRACGAGLLEITSEGDYQLRKIVDPSEYDADARSADFVAKVKQLRRRIETKMDTNIKALTDRYSKVSEFTRGMPQARQEEYAEAIEGEIRRWKEWGERLSALLDEASATSDDNILLTVGKEIEQGVVGPA